MGTKLYHLVPPDMRGTMLYPLNQLRSVHSDIYEEKVRKYDGREALLNRKVPVLDCLWNDALFLTLVTPADLRAAWDNAGLPIATKTFFEFDVDDLDANHLVIYKFENLLKQKAVDTTEFIAYQEEVVSDYNTVPERSKDYFSKCAQADERPKIFFGVPHILYNLPLDITDVLTVTV